MRCRPLFSFKCTVVAMKGTSQISDFKEPGCSVAELCNPPLHLHETNFPMGCSQPMTEYIRETQAGPLWGDTELL